MFRFLLSLLICSLSFASASADAWSDALFPERVKDFGSVPKGPALQHTFLLKNQSNQTVKLNGLRVSCGCVKAIAKQSIVPPGGSAAIEATMDTTRFDGAKSVTIYVQFEEPRRTEVSLWVRANSRDDVSILPNRLEFGRVKKGSSPTATATITFRGDRRAKILQVQCASNYIKPTVQEVNRGRSEVTYTLTAQLRSDTPVGKWFTDVWLSTSFDTMPRIRVPLIVEIESPLSITPSELALGEVKKDSELERKVILRGVKPYKVIGVRGADESITLLDSTSESRPIHILTIRVNTSTVGEKKWNLSIVTDLDGNEIPLPITTTVLAN